jgi:uncharacterized coiled-coil protein SlyX
MKPPIQLKPITSPVLIALGLLCLELLTQAQAVIPPPDGGYPNFTTAEGTNALQNLTTGAGKTGVGWYSLFSDTTGSLNTAVGGGALVLNNSDSNTAVGTAALLLNTDGNSNTAVGVSALQTNQTGFRNTALGTSALSVSTASFNTAVGYRALFSNTAGEQNVATGLEALFSNTTGNNNTAIGQSALISNTTGSGNTAIGDSAGGAVFSADHVICIGANVAGADASNTTWIGNVYGVTTQSGTTAPVIVSDTGQLGTVASSARFKNDIVQMDKVSEAILSLKPVTFYYKSDAKETPQFGLIAEEVAKVNPALVLPDKEGKPYTVRYEAVNAMLLNEFLKEHSRVNEQEKTISELKSALAQQEKQINALTTGLEKVSVQLELSKASRVVENDN